MKIKNLFFAAVALAGLSTMAQATTTIVITGSSAYRKYVDITLQGAGFGFAVTGYTQDPLNLGNTQKALAAVYTNSSTFPDTIILTSWSGSDAGIQTVAATSPTKTVGVLNPNTVVAGGGNADPRQGTNQVRPDIAMADNTQDSTKFKGTFLGVAYATLLEANVTPTSGTFDPFGTPITAGRRAVGVVPFVWAASASAGASYGIAQDTLNLTSQTAQQLFTYGSIPLALLTGNATDEGKSIIATGRDPDSGTRTTAFAESGFGIFGTAQQYKITASGGAITNLALYPATTVNGIPVGEGESGESSGADLANLMVNTGPDASVSPTGNAGFLVSYFSTGDGGFTGNRRLKYNGVAYSDANIQNGFYAFWAYERCFYRSGSTAATFADALASKMFNANAAVFIKNMKVARSTDGGVVAPLY